MDNLSPSGALPTSKSEPELAQGIIPYMQHDHKRSMSSDTTKIDSCAQKPGSIHESNQPRTPSPFWRRELRPSNRISRTNQAIQDILASRAKRALNESSGTADVHSISKQSEKQENVKSSTSAVESTDNHIPRNAWSCCQRHIMPDGEVFPIVYQALYLRECPFPDCGHQRCLMCEGPAAGW